MLHFQASFTFEIISTSYEDSEEYFASQRQPMSEIKVILILFAFWFFIFRQSVRR